MRGLEEDAALPRVAPRVLVVDEDGSIRAVNINAHRECAHTISGVAELMD
jgi:hypothetical protein